MSRLRAYAELVRLPNVFTALADICLGWFGALAAGTPATHWPAFALLLAASGCLYSAGMVWNDYFDVEQDRRERPFRPIPSGRITRRRAAVLGTLLLAAGMVFAVLAGCSGTERSSSMHWSPVVIAGCLIAAILLYDGWLKRTWVGPIGMGTCRFLNVLLGLSVAGAVPWPWGVHLALIVGVYIVGVTWFARTEARPSRASSLTGAALVMLAGLALGLAIPAWFPPDTASILFPYLLVGLVFLVGFPELRAVTQPSPSRVQAAVKRAIFGLVILDAVLAAGIAGSGGLLILLLLPPAMYLGRWIYST